MSLLDAESFPHKCRLQRRRIVKGRLGGNQRNMDTIQSDVDCWEQQASDSEVQRYEKRGMTITRKIFFLAETNVTSRFQIVITERDGVAVAAGDEVAMDVVSRAKPDNSAAFGLVYKVMVNEDVGAGN